MAKWSNNKFGRYTGQGPIAATLNPAVNFTLVSVKLHLNAAGGVSENFTIAVDSATGRKHDMNVLTHDMENVVDLFWFPDTLLVFEDADKIDFAYANSDHRDYGLEIVYRKAI